MTGISDQLIWFTILEAVYNNFTNQSKFYKDWKNFNSNNFALEFNDINWNEIMTMKNPNHYFNKFCNKLDNLINK